MRMLTRENGVKKFLSIKSLNQKGLNATKMDLKSLKCKEILIESSEDHIEFSLIGETFNVSLKKRLH